MSRTLRNGKQTWRHEREKYRMVTKCYFCKGKVREEHVTIDYRWGDRLFVVEDVPAGLCHQCGEKYLDSEVYRELEHLVRRGEKPMGRVTVDVLTFEDASPAA
jgi:YgiT-type zinc finger domain-containing protein